jgi:hypothetical protein
MVPWEGHCKLRNMEEGRSQAEGVMYGWRAGMMPIFTFILWSVLKDYLDPTPSDKQQLSFSVSYLTPWDMPSVSGEEWDLQSKAHSQEPVGPIVTEPWQWASGTMALDLPPGGAQPWPGQAPFPPHTASGMAHVYNPIWTLAWGSRASVGIRRIAGNR